jgi:hypothetical protein
MVFLYSDLHPFYLFSMLPPKWLSEIKPDLYLLYFKYFHVLPLFSEKKTKLYAMDWNINDSQNSYSKILNSFVIVLGGGALSLHKQN